MFSTISNTLYGQAPVAGNYGINDTIVSAAIVYNGDTIEAKTLENVFVYSRLNEAQMSARAKYNRLRNAVYVTYPYARRAGMVMNDINANLINVHQEDARKKYIKSRESELRKEFTNPLTNLSVYQGKVLMKLINRETGNNCYEIIKEYKGGFNARVYQTVAFFFNSNLKQSYNAKADDALIEKFVKEVQRMHGFVDNLELEQRLNKM
ncbi:MAG TPA: DUF4294 domain-containing protein [Ferruginibacter sp.]|nr:DUF4294 domain-containing protein [Ferruginibacter sp.]HRE64194.1 DUF4294 domain-containing protein [Ferruginibacter sp.]